jgi:hypothetical protein
VKKMAFKFVLLCATLALANAGYIEQPVAHYAPSVSYSSPVVSKTVAYSQPAAYYSQPAVYAAQPAYVAQQPYAKTVATYTSSPAISHYGYEHGTSEQNIVRSPHGTVSHISKAVDTPHSSVRKYDTRIVNDAPTYKVAAVAPVYQQVAAPVVTKTIATPVTYAHQAPVYTKTYAQAPVATYAHAPVATYAQAPVATYAHAPVATYAQAPVATYAHAAPVVKQAIQYSPAVAVSHASFEGLGAHYAW